MTTSQFWIYMVAILLSPLIAVQVTVWIQRYQEKRLRKLSIFKTLMATRASGLAAEHVQALNMIDIEFYGKDKKSREILRAWKAYLDHLTSGTPATEVWGSRREELFIELLHAMASCLKYEFDKTDIRRTSYFPVGHGEIETDQIRIRRGLVAVLEGKAALPVSVNPTTLSGGSNDRGRPT
jgi:hypothetical protein